MFDFEKGDLVRLIHNGEIRRGRLESVRDTSASPVADKRWKTNRKRYLVTLLDAELGQFRAFYTDRLEADVSEADAKDVDFYEPARRWPG